MLALTLTPSSAALPEVRRTVGGWARDHGVDPFALMLIAVELVTNAIDAGRSDGRIELRIDRQPGRAHIEVVDDGPGFDPSAPTPGGDLPPVSNERGRGLFLVRQLSRRLDIERVDGHTVVRAVVDAFDPPSPPGGAGPGPGGRSRNGPTQGADRADQRSLG